MLHVNVHEDVSVKVSFSDPDSNLLEYYVKRDAQPFDTIPFTVAQRAEATSEIPAPWDDLFSTSGAVSAAYLIKAVDENGQMTNAVSCTLMVIDTSFPSITLLAPYTDSGYHVNKLPLNAYALVTDDWAIDL